MTRLRTILHVDLNSFFATAEQQANPRLRGKPVGILKARGRNCIIAASIEAKKFGVKTGSNVFDAKKLCPQIVLVPADFDKYADITYRFIDICKSYSPKCEVFSLDECFIDVTESEKFFGGVLNIAFDIKKRLKEEIGDYMICSAGISHNKLLAKLASAQIKKDGLFLITDANALDVLDKSDLTEVCGLGFGLRKHLAKLGINSFPELREMPLSFLHKHFGPHWSTHLYNVCRGVDNSPVVPIFDIPDAKSVGRTYTTHRNLTTRTEILKLIRNLCEETAVKVRQMGLAGRYVGIAIRGGERKPFDGGGWLAAKNYKETWWGHRTLKNYIDDGKTLFDICVEISKNWPFLCQDKPFGYVRFCGVTLGMLTKAEYVPTPLFPWDRRRRRLVSSLDKINGKFGDYTVFPGQLLGTAIIRPEVNGYFGDRAYRLQGMIAET
jgi:DNA polymerase-4